MLGVVHWQNGQSQLNRMIQIFNGISNTTIYKGIDPELSDNSPENVFWDS